MIHARSIVVGPRFAMLVVIGIGMVSATASAAPIIGGVEAPTPDGYPGVGAQLYVAPRPVPPRVGHTWYTYPPFMPHEFLYKHRRHYVRPAGAMGMRTDVHGYWW